VTDLLPSFGPGRCPGHRRPPTILSASFVILLAVAGHETTRNSITQGMMAFTESRSSGELFKKERPLPTAVRRRIVRLGPNRR